VTDPCEIARPRELCEFLKFARSLISPAEAGIAVTGRRRVPGLRREEVAALCSVSVSWYTWFETGRPNVRASPRFIAAVARTLRLDPQHTIYLFSLALPEMPRIAAPVSTHVESALLGIASTWSQREEAAIADRCAPCDAFPIGVYCTMRDGKILYANDALVSLLGYPDRSSYLRLNVTDDLYADAHERVLWQAEIERLGRSRNVVATARRADGERVSVRDTAIAVRTRNGAPSCYLGVWERANARDAAPSMVFG